MIPDEHPGENVYMTIKDIEGILEVYGTDHDCKLSRAEIDQALAGLRDGKSVILGKTCLIQPEGEGLYCAYLTKNSKES